MLGPTQDDTITIRMRMNWKWRQTQNIHPHGIVNYHLTQTHNKGYDRGPDFSNKTATQDMRKIRHSSGNKAAI